MSSKKLTFALAALVPFMGSAFAEEKNIVVNGVNAMSEGPEYWTSERIEKAGELLPKRNMDKLSAQSWGTADLDFTRSRITPKSANTAAPYKQVGKLYFTIPGQGDFQCSASTIAKRLIVTAAHCMYSAGIGFHTNWVFIPGFDGSNAAKPRPFGTWNWSMGIIPTQWIDTGGALPNNDDFGILELVDQVIPPTQARLKKVGDYVGKFSTLEGRLFDNHATMLGYPCNFDSCNIMQRNDSSDHRGSGVEGSTAFEYGSDMTGGSSGGPWVQNFGDPMAAAPTGNWVERNAVIAVTSYGYVDPNVKILGASQFNANFTSIRTTACAHKAGNC